MNRASSKPNTGLSEILPTHRDLYYGGQWNKPAGGYQPTVNPATGEVLGDCAEASRRDVDAAVQAAHAAFAAWSRTKPSDRTAALRNIAGIVREHADDFALLDSLNCGVPIRDISHDVHIAAEQIDYFAGLAGELKGETLPGEAGIANMTWREPIGACVRIVAYNHPFMFTAAKMAAPLAAGNTVIIKPPAQAPLSSYRLMELLDGILPPGVLNVLTGSRECGAALVDHPLTPMVTLIGSVPTGRNIAQSAASRLKRILLELGGKNALIVYPDADVKRAIDGAVRGMNFPWCGQSCGSTSRLFVHEALYDEVVAGVVAGAQAFKPGVPTDPATNMGAIISKTQYDKIRSYIASGLEEGARLMTGGKPPADPELAHGYFIEPTVFADVTPTMHIAREEIFGPVLSVIRWCDEEKMLAQVNAVEYGPDGGHLHDKHCQCPSCGFDNSRRIHLGQQFQQALYWPAVWRL